MKDKINFGIGFISGRPNVCTIINSYGQFIVEQLKELNTEVNLTVYILYDLNYQHSKKEDFYKIKPEIYEHIKIKHITPENILEYKKEIKTRYNMTESDVELFIGSGYGKARNAILYCAMKDQMNSILFWDDDEYPVANVMYKNNLIWIKQKNALQHVKNIDKAAVTYGYRCGMMNPVPYIQYTDELTEETYKNFIDALENEVVS